MKTKKILISLLTAVLILTSNVGILQAAEFQSDSKEDLSNKMEYYEMKELELPDLNDDEYEANHIERPYHGKAFTITKDIGISTFSDEQNSSENTDPNNAYIVENDMIVQGTVSTESEARWYAFILDERSKVTIFAQMVDSIDADLYVFSLNQETSTLDLIGGSATEGAGLQEYVYGVLDPGVYFFSIQSYEGIGDFAFAFYQNANVEGEPNETPETASTTALGATISGVIDNPYDIDYYKLELTTAVGFQYSFSTSANYEMRILSNNGKMLSLPSTGMYKLFPGTYYFKVFSKDMSYSPTQEYTISTTKLGDMVSDSRAKVLGICEKANIFYETDLGTVHYVNGHTIDPSYSYINEISNSAGYQSYNITIDKSKVSSVVLSGVYEPDIVYYISSTRPAMNVGSKFVLSLTFTGDNLYKIHNYCTGAYSMNNFSEDFNYVNVLIDPATGKLVDILSFNYYYDFAPVGSNKILFTRPGWGLDLYEVKEGNS